MGLSKTLSSSRAHSLTGQDFCDISVNPVRFICYLFDLHIYFPSKHFTLYNAHSSAGLYNCQLTFEKSLRGLS